MANINDIYTSGNDYLKADELRKPDGSFAAFQCVIESVEVKDMASNEDKDKGKSEYKAVLSLVGRDKQVVLNKTNGLKVASAYGAETDNWPGKPITITGSLKSFGGRMVAGIDVYVQPQITTDESYHQEQAAAAAPAAGIAHGDEDIPF